MGRSRYSDSDDDRRKYKKKRRSRSRSLSSDSSYNSRQSKTKKSKKSRQRKRKSRSRSPERSKRRRSYSRSPSRSKDRYDRYESSRGRRSRSRSKERRYRSPSRSWSRDRSMSRDRRYRSRSRERSYRARSRSRSRDRRRSRSRDRRRSRSRSRDRRRSRSRSQARRYKSRSRSRSSSRRSSRRSTPERRRRENEKDLKSEQDDPTATIPGFDRMPPLKQAEIRMQLALKAADAANEKLKAQGVLAGASTSSTSAPSIADQLNRAKMIEDIESDGFRPVSFKSGVTNKPKAKKRKPNSNGVSGDMSHEMAMFGTGNAPVDLDTMIKKRIESDALLGDILYEDMETKMKRWVQKLTMMRKQNLEGEAMS